MKPITATLLLWVLTLLVAIGAFGEDNDEKHSLPNPLGVDEVKHDEKNEK